MSLESLAKSALDYPGDTNEERWAGLIEAKLITVGEPPFSPFWWQEYRNFWRSGAISFVACKANRAAGTTHAQRMEVLPSILFRERSGIAGQELVYPSCSATLQLANGAIALMVAALEALGFNKVARRADVGANTFFESRGTHAIPGCVVLEDINERQVEFRSQTASLAGMSGFTGIGALLDEMGLWKSDADPPAKVLELAMSRLLGQGGARAALISRAFSEDDLLFKKAMSGDNESTYIARLGERGARADEEGRRGLREYLAGRAMLGDQEARRAATDPRLSEPADPSSFILSTWACLPVPSAAEKAIQCWRLVLAGEDVDRGENRLDGFFRVFGGRPSGAEGEVMYPLDLLNEARLVA